MFANRPTHPARHHAPPRPSVRTAFTLMEVLLALALSGVLMASVVGSLDLYRRLATSGQRDVARARLARALFDRISDDLRSVTFTPSEDDTTGSADGDLGAAEEGGEDEVVTTSGDVDTESAFASGSIGIAGDGLSIVIHTNQPERSEATAGFTLPELLQLGGRTSDQRSVSYFVAQTGRGGLVGVVADRLLQSSGDRALQRDEPLGLVRLEGDRLSMSLADDTGDYEALAAGATLIAPEVKSMRLAYFDGAMWHDVWDTDAYQFLPRAVEVTFGIRIDEEQPAPRTPGQLGEEQRAHVVEHRFVIALPQADPSVIEELLQ